MPKPIQALADDGQAHCPLTQDFFFSTATDSSTEIGRDLSEGHTSLLFTFFVTITGHIPQIR